MKKKQNSLLTLAIDIGGTGIKMMVLGPKGQPKTDYIRELTPKPATLKAVLLLIKRMSQSFSIPFDRVSAGFPGVVCNGIVETAPHMHTTWVGINLQKELERITGCPVRVANDADVQGYGDVSGKGVELVITLGTGFGSALFLDGKLVPNLEMGHHPCKDNVTYEQLLGKAAFEAIGVRKWNTNLKLVIALLNQTFNYDTLYIGGGYSHAVKLKLPENVKISGNVEGVLGGIKLWK